MDRFTMKNVSLAWVGFFWPKRGHISKLFVSKVTFDLEYRFSVKNWPRKHICHEKLFRTQQVVIFRQETCCWEPVWDPQNLKNDFFKKCSNLTSEQCFYAKLGWIIDFEQRKCPKVPISAFLWGFLVLAKFTGSTLWRQKWRFCEVHNSSVCCPL